MFMYNWGEQFAEVYIVDLIYIVDLTALRSSRVSNDDLSFTSLLHLSPSLTTIMSSNMFSATTSSLLIVMVCILLLSFDSQARQILSSTRQRRTGSENENGPRRPCGSGGRRPNHDDNWEDEECFPADAVVFPASGLAVTMSQLLVGAHISQVTGESSLVYSLSHSYGNVIATFVRLVTVTGNLTLTRGHYTYTLAGLRAAGDIRRGDMLQMGVNHFIFVHNVEVVRMRGLYNAHTLSGEMMVNGFRVTSYTTAVQPTAAKGLLAPMRALYRALQIDFLSPLWSYFRTKQLITPLRLSGMYANVPLMSFQGALLWSPV